MFFDEPQFGRTETKADPFSLESLIAWLEKMPADEKYPYMSFRGCIACQYLQSFGYAEPWKDEPDSGQALYARAMGGEDGYHKIAQERPWTFGAALTRAREALASRA